MRKLLLLLGLMVYCISFVHSQTAQELPGTLSGQVKDATTGAAVAGATVKEKGGTATAVTDENGRYILRVSRKAKILVFSFVGYNDQEIQIESSAVNAFLQQNTQSLNEVVVVGYGTRTKRDVTGSIATVGAKEITNTPATSFESAIQGRAAGVQVSQQNGKLGQAINIRIRGAASVSGGNEPLYVVDGVPVTSGDLSNNDAATNALADINMNDIESIQILKDASAAAIYGSRASNGVVLITTKKGKAGTSKIEFGYFTGFQKPTGKREFLNAKQWVDFFTQAAYGAAKQDTIYYGGTLADAQASELDYVQSRFTRYGAGTDDWKAAKTYTNWQDQAFQDAPISQYDLNISGGTDKTKFYLSGQYLDQTGILIGNSYKRYSARLNLDHQVKSWLTVGMNFDFSKSRNYRLSDDDQFSTPLQIVALSPITPLIDPRTGLISGAFDTNPNNYGNPNTNYPVYYNPLLSKDNQYYHTFVNRTLGNAYGNVNILPGFIFRSEFGVDQLNQTEDLWYGRLTARNTTVPDGQAYYYTTAVLNMNVNNYFNYKKTFGEVHDVDITAGMSYQDQTYDKSTAAAEEFPSDAYKKLASGASKTQASTNSTSKTWLSYFGRFNYKLNNRYLFALSGRFDASSVFGANNRWGFFPAASAGWVLSEENFLARSKFVNFLKLKASYGLTGNDDIPFYASRGLFTATSYGGQAGQRPSQLPNSNLKWESTLGLDLGVEASILNNRISIELDYYERHTKDLLLEVQVPGTSGFSNQYQNIGKLQNKGFEITINTTNIASKAFHWTTNLNFSLNKNKITALGGQILGTDQNKAKEGEPLGVFYAREFAGVDPANGDALYYKNTVKENGTIDRSTTNNYNEATDVRIGSPLPDFTYGFGNTFTYQTFDLDVLLQGVHGNQIYNGGGQYMSSSGSNGFDNQTIDQLKAWKNPGDITNVPEARLFYPNGTDPSSRYISSGAYLRVKSITFGYNFPKTLLNKWKLERLRIYARAQNLFTITKYKGWDPEVNSDFQASNINQGVDFYSAPQLKTIVFGINLSL